jgi:hypothetical protein
MQQSGLMHRFLLTRFLHRRHTAAVIAFRPDGNLQRQHCILFSRQKQIVFPAKTNCFSAENKLFFQQKQTVFSGKTRVTRKTQEDDERPSHVFFHSQHKKNRLNCQ